jgi:hypothetical protein
MLFNGWVYEICTVSVEGGDPALSTVYLTEKFMVIFHPCGNRNSHLSNRNGADAKFKVRCHSCEK